MVVHFSIFLFFFLKAPSSKIWTPNSDSGSGNSDAGVTRRDAHRSGESFKILILVLMRITCSIQCCLLYPLLPGGTLEKRLRRNSSAFPLSAVQRTDVALGVARGLHFLHTRPKCMIHRDIKSSNILLDHNHLPKIADFGLLRYPLLFYT